MMLKINRSLLGILLMIALVLTDPLCALAANDGEAQTAAKTIKASSDEETEETEGEKEAEKSSEEDEDKDGASQKTDNYAIERMDITEMTEVRIGSYEDWTAFVHNCELDSWSADKYVVLTNDIECNMQKFEPVPYFAGVFDGDGHTINKAAFTREDNYVGIFSKTAPVAVIRNVNVIGVMKPDGKPFDIGGIVGENAGMIAECKYDGYVEGFDYIGGIAGYNDATGIISSCSVKGKITGLHHVGGICGANAGLVTGCSSSADINTVTKDVETSLADIKVEEIFTSLINLGKEEGNKKSISASTTPVDVGGIAGLNIGEISSSVNGSKVGYEHVGYNVGGIAGRQSGYVHECINNGKVKGRKDVGGVVGQAEPYIRLDLSADVIAQISASIDKLHDSIDRTIKDTDSSAGTVSARLNVIKNFADKALGDTGYLANSTQDYVNGVVGATNEIVGRMEYVLDEAAKSDGPVQDLAEAGSNLKDATGDLEKVAEDLNIYKYMDEAEIAHYDTAKKNLKEATKEFTGYFKEKEDEVYPVDFDKKYYQILMDLPDLPDERPTEEQIAEAEEGKSEEEIEEAKIDADVYAAADAAVEADKYANEKYTGEHGTVYSEDAKLYSETIADSVLNHADKMVEDARKDGKEAFSDVKKMAGSIKDAGSRLREIIGNVAGKSDVRFPQLSEEYRLHTNSLVANIQGMSDNLGFLNGEMKGSTDAVCKDLEGVNDQFATLMLLFTDAMDGALDMDYSEVFKDESDDVCNESIDATVTGCINNGYVYADINTGGIAGTMAQEYDFDLESDITGIKDAAKKSTYRTKCVLRDDTNKGEVRGKKSYVGGACGLHEIGTILRCSNFDKVSSETSDYVGGIAGRSYSTIRNSYDKGVVSGGSYIGGIAGDGSDIIDCVAMPVVTEAKSFKGAIAGNTDDSGKVEGNVFVSDSLAGIDRISKSGKAEPISYDSLLSLENIPAEFSTIDIDFIVDGKIVACVEKKPGEVVSSKDTPMDTEIATKGKKSKKSKDKEDKDKDRVILEEDQYIDWDCDEEIVAYEDMEIQGEIVRYSTSLASEQVRQNKQSILLVDGRFLKDEELIVSDIVAPGPLTEEFVLTIPDDGAVSHRIRYQMPDDVNEVKLYVKSGNDYNEVKYDTYGKYLTFEAPGNEVMIRAVAEDDEELIKKVVIAGICIVLIIILLIVIIICRHIGKKRKAARSRKTADQNPEKSKHEKGKPGKNTSDSNKTDQDKT